MKRVAFWKYKQSRRIMNIATAIAVMSLLFLLPFAVHAQQQAQPEKREITGIVVDQKGEALAGANIFVKGTVIGVSAGLDGHFKLSVPVVNDKPIVLVCTFVGFKDREVLLGDKTDLKIILVDDVNNLNEVTAIAYGNRKQRDLVTSIASVKAKDIEDMPTANLENLLQGQMAGVQVTNMSGAPGAGGTIVNIRGVNAIMVKDANNLINNQAQVVNDGSPLYVVDGVPITSSVSAETGTNTLAEIDPSTIESVEVLKDAASAALYGSRASNGVILITTKQGKEGKAKITANVSYGISILPETPLQTTGKAERDLQIEMMKHSSFGGRDRMGNYVYPTSYKEALQQGGMYDAFWGYNGMGFSPDVYTAALQDSLNPFYNNSTNWWKYAFSSGKTTNANVQASGGSELIKYMMGVGLYKEQGIMPNSSFQRGNFSVNLSVKPRKNITIDSRNYFAFTDRSLGGNNGNGVGVMMVSPSSMSTVLPGDGDLFNAIQKGIGSHININKSFRIRSNLKVGIELLPGLNFSTSGAIDYTQSRKNDFSPSDLDQTNHFNKSEGGVSGTSLITVDNLLNYTREIKKHHLEFLLGQSYTSKTYMSYGGYAENLAGDGIHYVPSDANQTTTDQFGTIIPLMRYYSTFTESRMLSYFGRVAYNYNKKYLMEVTVRSDGSSVFGDNVRWGTFPSIALGWNFSDENFAKDWWWLNYGKFRASWGTSGQQFNSPYMAKGLMGSNTYTFMGNSGLAPDMLMSGNLTWEKSAQTDIGLDAHFLDHRLKITMDYYYKKGTSLINKVQLPGDVYYSNSAWINAMGMNNEGVEFSATYDVITNKPVTWRTQFNIARNSTTMAESYNNMDIVVGKQTYVLGRSPYSLYVYKTDGYIQSANDIPVYYNPSGNKQPIYDTQQEALFQKGMRKVEDMNGDGVVNVNDQVYAGSTLPTASGGWTNQLKWKNWDMNILITYTLGRSMINAYSRKGLELKQNLAPLFFDYNSTTFWQNPGDNTSQPAYNDGNMYTTLYSPMLDVNVEHVSYMRLKKITMGYTLPDEFVKKSFISSARIYGTIENLFLLSNYSGTDPEVVPIQTGIDDMDSYPLPRVFTLGLSLKF